MLKYDIAVIGGGPAGIMAAIQSCRSSRVILLEKNNRLGLKLLLTGGGRCNITNNKPPKELLSHYGEGNFLKHSFFTFTNDDLLNFFRNRGLDFTVEDNDRVFPSTHSSRDVLKILEDALEGVVIRYNFEVKSIREGFIINDEIHASKIIIATGGITYPQTGTSPKNYSLTPQPVTDIRYGLAPLITREDVSELAGVTLHDVGITYKKKIRENVLFSHFGISGPGILNISNEISKSISYNLLDCEGDVDVKIHLDLAADMSHEKLHEMFNTDFQKKGIIKNYLKKFFPQKFYEFFLKSIGVECNMQLSQIRRRDKNIIVENMKKFTLHITGFRGDLSKVTVGGVDLKYINSKTMESTLIDNLYFAGEVLDLHGPSGGYNLKIAFSTGYLAGISASHF